MSWLSSYVVKFDGTFVYIKDLSLNEQRDVAKLYLRDGGPVDVDRQFPFIEKLFIQNLFRISVKKCFNLKKIGCHNIVMLDVGKIRPFIQGHVQFFHLEQHYDFFPSLLYSEMIIEK
jgi:hypothetical protein